MVDRQILLTAVESRLTHRNPTLEILQQLLKPSRILMAGDLNICFKSNRKVPQGSCIGPVLFNVFLDTVLTDGLRDIKGLNIESDVLAYADDMAIFLKDGQQFRQLYSLFTMKLPSKGVDISLKKIEVLPLVRGLSKGKYSFDPKYTSKSLCKFKFL